MRRRKARGLVTVYRHRGRWILARSDYSSDGMWISADAVSLGDVVPSAAELGTACHRALRATGRAPRRARGDRSAPTPPEVQVAGAGSWRGFAVVAEAVQAELLDDTITVSRLVRHRDYFTEELETAAHLCGDVSATTLGAQLLTLLDG